MKILVTGGNGFIGGNFIKWFRKNKPGNQIFNMSRHPHEDTVSFINDLQDLRITEKIITSLKPDQIYHFAANPNPKVTEDINAHFTENVFTTNNLFYACRELKPKIFLASSIVVHPEHMTHIDKPKSIYGVSKLTCEYLARMYNENFKIPIIIGRFGASLGSGLKRGLIYDIVQKLKSDNKTLNLIGTSPGPYKPYTLLDRIFPKIWTAMQTYENYTNDYANYDCLSVEQVAKICMKKLGIIKPIEWDSSQRQWGDHNYLCSASNMYGSDTDIETYLESIC